MDKLSPRREWFAGELPYVAVGSGPPLVYLCGSMPNHRHPKPGLEELSTLRSVMPLARAGFEVFYTNRWPGMPAGISFAEVAERHAEAVEAHFGEPVDVLGHSTGGSLLLQLLVDRPDVVRRAIVASAAYALGPVGRRAQRSMWESLERTGRFSTTSMVEGLEGMVQHRWLRTALTPLAALAAARIDVEQPGDTIAMLRAEDAFDIRERLSSIRTPTLIAAGGRDNFWPPEMFAETAAGIPDARFRLYPRLGHDLVAAPDFVADVTAFLRSER